MVGVDFHDGQLNSANVQTLSFFGPIIAPQVRSEIKRGRVQICSDYCGHTDRHLYTFLRNLLRLHHILAWRRRESQKPPLSSNHPWIFSCAHGRGSGTNER